MTSTPEVVYPDPTCISHVSSQVIVHSQVLVGWSSRPHSPVVFFETMGTGTPLRQEYTLLHSTPETRILNQSTELLVSKVTLGVFHGVVQKTTAEEPWTGSHRRLAISSDSDRFSPTPPGPSPGPSPSLGDDGTGRTRRGRLHESNP